MTSIAPITTGSWATLLDFGIHNYIIGSYIYLSTTPNNKDLWVTLLAGDLNFRLHYICCLMSESRCYMAEILPIRRKTLSNQSINHVQNTELFSPIKL